jgi:hypothetical protein
VDEVLFTDYLSEAEAAYQRGEIGDYFLFPTGKPKEGADVPLCRATDKPLSDHALREKFGELEAIAGVEHRKGRAFYGLRRQATDLAPEFAQDAQVLNRISGHSNSATCGRLLLRRTKRKPYEPIPHLSHPGRVPGRAEWRKLQQERYLDAARAVAGSAGSGRAESTESTEFARAGSDGPAATATTTGGIGTRRRSRVAPGFCGGVGNGGGMDARQGAMRIFLRLPLRFPERSRACPSITRCAIR